MRSVLLFSKPSPQRLRESLLSQEKGTFSYREVGASRVQAPSGYTVDHNRVQLGKGADCFKRAKMFDISWLELCWPNSPIEAGTTVAVLVSHLKFWSLNACRIVCVIQEGHATEIYGFAYGTLNDHGETGEERFTVEFKSHGLICVVRHLCILAAATPAALGLSVHKVIAKTIRTRFVAGNVEGCKLVTRVRSTPATACR